MNLTRIGRCALGMSLGLASLLSVAGCTSESGSTTPSSAPPPAQRSAAAHQSQQWHPDQPIPLPAPLTGEEKRQLRNDYLQSLATMNEMSALPGVALVRWTTLDTVNSVWAKCYTEGGFPARPSRDGLGIDHIGGIKPAQESAFNSVEYACNAKYTIDPTYTRKLTDDQAGLVYDYYTQSFVPCLRDHGVSITDPPAKAAFVAGFPSAWDPVAQANKLGEVAKDCPARPPSSDLYG